MAETDTSRHLPLSAFMALGFGALLAIILAIIVIGIGQVRGLGGRIAEIVDQQSRKAELVVKMRTIQQERRLALMEFRHLEDPFERDAARMRLVEHANAFIAVRDAFLDLPLDGSEQAAWRDIRQAILDVEAHLDRLFESPAGTIPAAQMAARLAPVHAAQQRMFSAWDHLLDLQKAKNQSVRTYADDLLYQTRAVFFGMGTLALGIGVMLAVFIIRRSRQQERALRLEQAKAERTLDAMSDAVIRQDPDGRICYLNPAARDLLGVGPDEGMDRPGNEVLRLIDHPRRRPLLDSLRAQAASLDRIALGEDVRLLGRQDIELEVEGVFRAIRDRSGSLRGYVTVLRDVTEAREWMRQQADLWDRDPLTSLPGRRYLETRLAKVLLQKRAADLPMAYLHVHVPHIGEFATAEGEAAGNALVRHVVALLRTQVRETDLIARVGEHAFGLLLTTCPEEIARRIEAGVREHLGHFRFEWEGRTQAFSGEIRCVYKPNFSGSPEELLALVGTDTA